jgi:hypothetical protein
MRRGISVLIAVLCVAVWHNPYAQGAGQPLQIGPGTTAPDAGAKVPKNWSIRDNGPEALTDQPTRMAITLPKSTPIIDGKSVTTGLILRCGINPDGPPLPQLTVIFTSLTGIGHFQKVNIKYRFDEGPVHGMELKSIIGKNFIRAIVVPNTAVPPPGVEIASATRFRIEIDFKSAGVTFLDFNVTGATQALRAIGCH